MTLLKSSCVCSVYICSVRSILWAPSLHCFTSCGACIGERLPQAGPRPGSPLPPPIQPGLAAHALALMAARVPVLPRPTDCVSSTLSGPQFSHQHARSLGGTTWKHSLPRPQGLCSQAGLVPTSYMRPLLLWVLLTLLMALSARLAALYLSGWPCVLRQSVCRKTLHMRSHEQPSVPWLSGLPGAGAPQPVPDLGDTQRAPARPHPFSPWLSSSSREGPKPLFLHVPEGPGGSDILSAWDADPGSMGHRLPLRAQLGPCVHVCTCTVPAVCVHLCTCVCLCSFHPHEPLSHELASQSMSHSREPLGTAMESGSPQVHTGQLTEGLWVGGSHNPGLTLGRGLGDTKSDLGCECTP